MASAPPGLEILRPLSEGPVERHYEARQVPLGRRVRAVALAPGLLPSSALAAPLRKEAEALARLDHPNIVRLYELREDQHSLWRIEEFVDGPPLSSVLGRPVSISAAAAIAHGIGSALAHAHSKGIVHGRLGAGNVHFNHQGEVKVGGFRATGHDDEIESIDSEAAEGVAPEVTVGQATTASSDLFALGILLYAMLTGQRPFGASASPNYSTQVRNETPPPLLKSRPDTPPGLQQLVERCLQKLPADRPSDAASVVASLAEFCPEARRDAIVRQLAELGLLTAVPSLPDTPTPGARRGRSPFRHPAALLALGALSGALLAVAVFVERERRPEPEPSQATLSTRVASESMLLRVVATPWAHVLIDGVHRETTPFARPILLAPGRHMVRLEHPYAAPEERIVEGQAGQGVFLDVQMMVNEPVESSLPEALDQDDSP